MKVLNKNKKVSLYGNLNIKILSEKIEKNICISIENNYNWMNINKKVKTTKIVVDNEIINSNCSANIYGYVEDWRGLPSENGKKYEFCINEISIEDIFSELELLYDEYICDFDTIKDGLKFVIEKIEIK